MTYTMTESQKKTMEHISNPAPEERPPERIPGTPEFYKMLEEKYIEVVKIQNRKPARENYTCPICMDNGGIWSVGFVGGCPQLKFEICGCRKNRNADKTIADYEAAEKWQAKIKASAEDYIKRSKHDAWFFIGGQVGSGKSHVCGAIAREMINRGLTVETMPWNECSRRLKSVVMDWGYEKEMRNFQLAPVLVIDDFFLTDPTEADIRLARELLDYRYDRELRTIINSEKNLAEIRDADEGLYSRIKQRAGGYINNIRRDRGRDWRTK